MGKSSRQKRRTYQSPKKARTGGNLVWYAAAFILVVGGVLGVALSRSNSASGIGPTLSDHWHAALGVNDCGKWDPNWTTPFATVNGASEPVRSGTNAYAGLHSHGDGMIHMEPQTSDELGNHATLGQYFKFAGFKLNATSITFGTLDPTTTVTEKNGNKCNGKSGVLRWAVNGKEKHGNPASYKIFDGDVIELVFTTADAKLPAKTAVPSYAALQSILGESNPTEPAPGVTTPTGSTGVTGTTVAGATTTAATGSTTAPATTPTTVGATTTSTP
jgi:hypothetical protein